MTLTPVLVDAATRRDHIHRKAVEGVQNVFPLQARDHNVEVENVHVKPKEFSSREQKEAILHGRTLQESLRGDVLLRDPQGKVIERQKNVTLGQIPFFTQRHTFIVDGNEYSVANQRRVRPGVYTRVRGNEELEAAFNLGKGENFRVNMDPAKGHMFLQYGSTNIPLYPVLKRMGVSDTEMSKRWGGGVVSKNRDAFAKKEVQAVDKLYDRLVPPYQRTATTIESKAREIETRYQDTQLDPEITERTLGERFSHVNPRALMRASQKILDVHREGVDTDDRDSLAFQTLHTVDDFVKERIQLEGRSLARKVRLKASGGAAPTLTRVLPNSPFTRSLRSFVTSSALASIPAQINPIEIIDSAVRITSLGEGGIGSERAVPDEARRLHHTHFGVIDPSRTPECYVEDMEVFTSEGWKPWPEVTRNTLFACRVQHGLEDRLEFHKPTHLVNEVYDGPIYGVKTGKIHYAVTPTHRVLCRYEDSSVWRIQRAEDVHEAWSRIFDTGHDAYIGDAPDTFQLPPVKSAPKEQYPAHGGYLTDTTVTVPPLNMEDWAAFMGWFLAEGNTTYDETYPTYRVDISQSRSASPVNCLKIEKLLNRLPFAWHYSGHSFHIAVKQLAAYCYQFGYCDDKYIPEYFFTASLDTRGKLLETLLLGDGREGSRRATGCQYEQTVFCTASPRLATGFERLAISLGYATRTARYVDKREERYLDTYEVRVMQHRYRHARYRKGHYFTEHYTGRVYCAEVPGGLLYVRRGGSVPLWSGNSFRAGIDLRASLWTKKDSNGRMHTLMRNTRTGKLEDVSVRKLEASTLAFPGETKKTRGISALKDGQLISVSKKDVDYELPHPSFMFSPATNTVPMPENMQGNRLLMGSKMATQALPLLEREVPHVQVASYNPGRTFEQELARLIVPHAPVAGIIKKIDRDYIYLEPSTRKEASIAPNTLPEIASVEHVTLADDGEKVAASTLIKIPYDTDFPLASKTYLHNTVTVKKGDKVEANDLLADSNFTRDGRLALGRNMNVGFLAYYGMNTNDAVVVSETGANKLTSEHMYKESLLIDSDVTLDKNKHRAQFGNRWTAAQYDNLDERGVAKPGATLHPGDPVILAIRKTAPSAEMQLLGRLHRTLATPYREQSVVWDHRNKGRVIDVVVTSQHALVTLKTQEAADIGDKLCFTQDTEVLTQHGWKDIEDIVPGDVIYTIHEGQIILQEVCSTHYYPCAGELYELESQQVDLRVTTNHALYIQLRGRDAYERVPALEAYGKRCRHKKDGTWQSPTPETFSLPVLNTATQGKGYRQQQKAADRHVPVAMRPWLQFLGVYLANGSYIIHERKDRPGTVDYRVNVHTIRDQTHSVSGDQYTWIRGVLDECGFSYVERDDRFVINSKQLTLYLAQFGHAKDKHVPPTCFTWGADAARWLLEGLVGCDGHLTHSNSLGYTTTSLQLADDVQRLALHRGWSANVKVHHPQKRTWSTIYRVHIIRSKNAPQINHGHTHRQNGQQERFTKSDEPVWGITVPNSTLYVRVNGKPVWTGNSGRYGNKGVISKVLPDDQMPRTKSGTTLDMLLPPTGVISRVNPAQIIETAVAKVAAKTGKPIVVPSMSGRNNVEWAKKLLKEHNLTDKEVLYNPATGKDIKGPDGKGVMVGPQYTYKLFKSTETNYSARGIKDYDVNLQPTKGGADGAKALGRMEINALLGHNARNVLHEAGSLKSSRNDDFWRAYQLGEPLPAMKASFTADKFANMLRGAGIKVDKSNEQVRLGPMTDADITTLSSGEIKRATMIREKDFAPEKDGLFDPVVTGGTNGTRWSHVNLAEPIVNPTFEDPVRRMLGLTKSEFQRTLQEEGGKGVQKRLRDVDMTAYEKRLREEVRTATGTKLDGAVKQLKAARALQREKLTPDKAYVLSKLPIVPPVVRPILPSRGRRDLLISDANYLYRDAMLANGMLSDAKRDLPEKEVGLARQHLYDATKAVFGLGEAVSPQLQGRGAKGFITTIAGQGSPKRGFFHSKVLYKPQDLSGRGTAVPDMNLNMDEIGLPEDMLWTTYGPHIMRKMVQGGYKAVDAQKMIEDRHPAANDALRSETKKRPIILNRAPTLHRFGILGAYPIPVPGKTIRVNPFIEKGLGLDYDGDTLQIHVPVTEKAVGEVRGMTLSNLLFGDKTKSDLLVFPQHEAIAGVHHASSATGGKKHRFKTKQAALDAYRRGEIGLKDTVQIG